MTPRKRTAPAPKKGTPARKPKLEPGHRPIPERAYNTFMAARANRKQWEDVEAAARAQIEDALGDDEFGEVDGKVVLTYKHSKASVLNQKALKDAHPELVAEFYEFVERRTFKPVEQ